MSGEREAAGAAAREGAPSPRVRAAGLWLGAGLALAILLTPDLGLDPLQRRAAAVAAFVATMWLTQAVPLGAASLLPAALLPAFGVLDARKAAAAYMDDIVLLFLGAMIVAAGLERWGVHRRMALALVEAVGTRPRRLVLGFTLATAFVSLWINNTAATLMMYPIGLAVIATTTGERAPRSSAFAVALLLGIAYGASIGGIATPVGTAPNQIFLGQLRQQFPDAPLPSFAEWALAWLPFAALFALGTSWIVTRLGERVASGALAARDTIRSERAKLGRIGRGELSMAIVFGVTALLWVTREDVDLGALTIPGWGESLARAQRVGEVAAGAPRLARYVTDATVAVAMACVCFFVPVDRKRGVYLLEWESVARLPWDVLLLFGGGFCLAEGFRASQLDLTLGQALAPWLEGRSTWVVVGAIALFMTLLSELTSNTVITQLMLPILGQTAVSSGVDPRLVMVPATVAASCGFMLPIATPPNAIAFSSGRIPISKMARLGLAVDLLGVVLVTLVFHFWVRRVWHIGAELPSWAER